MRVLGIDPGTATTGWAVLEEIKGAIQPVAFGHITTSKFLSDEERLCEICQDVEKISEKFRPEEAAIEEIFFFKNQKTVITVAQARGAIILTLKQKKIPISSYTPLQVKQAITSYGRADKCQVQAMTKCILKLKEIPKPDDAADAVAVALCHINSKQKFNF